MCAGPALYPPLVRGEFSNGTSCGPMTVALWSPYRRLLGIKLGQQVAFRATKEKG